MEEVLVNSLNKVYYDIFVDGEPTAPDNGGAVTAILYKDGLDPVQVDPVPVVDSPGRYSLILPLELIRTEGELDVEWEFTVDGQNMLDRRQYQVVTPYCNWKPFYDLERYTYVDWVEAERVSRMIIHGYCGQPFGRRDATFSVEGNGSDQLVLPWRLIELEEVTWKTFPPPRPGVVIDTMHYEWEITAQGWMLRTQPNRVAIDPVYRSRPTFRRNIKFDVKGAWGYEAVPVPVREASKILTANYLCGDHKYRDRYLESIKIHERRMQFSSLAFEGTGDATVDSLLADYRTHPVFGVI